MKKTDKKFKYLLLIPILGATICYGIVYAQRSKYERITLKTFFGYILLSFFLIILSFGLSVLISYILGIKSVTIGLIIMWIIGGILLDVVFINMYRKYLQE